MQHHVLTETSGFEVVQTVSKVEWKSATAMHGALCVMTLGAHLMQELYADNLDLLQQVHMQLHVDSDKEKDMELQLLMYRHDLYALVLQFHL